MSCTDSEIIVRSSIPLSTKREHSIAFPLEGGMKEVDKKIGRSVVVRKSASITRQEMTMTKIRRRENQHGRKRRNQGAMGYRIGYDDNGIDE